MRFIACIGFLCAILSAPAIAGSQERTSVNSELRLRLVSSLPAKHRAVPAVLWLEPRAGTPVLPFIAQGRYTLLQKNRAFVPHLLVIPAGSSVQFPNADPFFHNVFSLFEGKRFDLGLYEAGSSRSVTFSRPGVSYIFCNIHPEMSAVVLALSTPLYAIADKSDSFDLPNIPAGDYNFHIWIEGVPQPFLEGLTRSIHFSARPVDLGTLAAPIAGTNATAHTNKFGRPYDLDTQSPY